MTEYPVRANFFDASALAKVFSQEYDSRQLAEYFHNHAATKFTTPFCLYETPNILKSKWMYRGELNKSEYLEASFKLIAWYGAATRHVRDLELSDPHILRKTREIAEKYTLDLSDSVQLLTVKEGEYSFFVDDSETLLVTADKHLAEAAKEEGLKTWYCMGDGIPK